jgi:hypothetical protein
LGAETSEIEGTGIGLVVTKEIIELMGGDIGFESTVWEGITFWFELPMSDETFVREELAKQKKETTAPSELKQTAGTLLYVEDNLENLELIILIVERVDGLSLISESTAKQVLNWRERKLRILSF